MQIVRGPCLKMLVAYYSYTGNTRTIAQEVRQKTCGVLFSVETHRTYSCRTVAAQARRELESGELPALKYPAPNMACYDLILVGGPVWSRTLPPPLRAFLRCVDFVGKGVAAFCTHECGAGDFFRDFTSMAHNARMLEGLSLNICYSEYGPVMSAMLDLWLQKLGILDLHAP